MNDMKRLATLLIGLFLLGTPLMAQYNVAVGVRAGGTSGITIKKNYTHSAIEGIIGFWRHGVSITGLYERHPGVTGVNGLHWIYGAGGHVRFYNPEFSKKNRGPWYYGYPNEVDPGALGLGVDGIFGVEYKFPAIPFAMSLDVKPFIEFTSDGYAWFAIDPGLGLKLAF